MNYPVLIYDDHCLSCTNYAILADKILNGRITMIGHHTKRGIEFKRMIFPDGYDGLEMSWFVTETKSYGGRRGLWKLFQYALFGRHGEFTKNIFDQSECTTECSTSIKGMANRTKSIIIDGVVIKRKDMKT